MHIVVLYNTYIHTIEINFQYRTTVSVQVLHSSTTAPYMHTGRCSTGTVQYSVLYLNLFCEILSYVQ